MAENSAIVVRPANQKLEGKVAIITGGASGMGEATAHLFASEGALMVVIADIQDQLGQAVASSIGLQRCTYIHCDVTDEDQVKSLIETTIQRFGHLDIMFSNAGIAVSNQNILNLDFGAMDRVFAVNARGMAVCVKHAAIAMIEGGVRGSIVCTASTTARVGSNRGLQDYTMSKHAVLGLVRSASCELGKYGIRVNCVSPSAVATPLLMRLNGFTDKETAEEAFAGDACLKGIRLKAEHVAEAVLFLASDQSAFVSGCDLAVDGGFCIP
ncbi:hypothetical protein ACHQM5_030799 [Ranunculus cassubicifolius]